jgi:hypothetical protein
VDPIETIERSSQFECRNRNESGRQATLRHEDLAVSGVLGDAADSSSRFDILGKVKVADPGL